VRCSDHLPLPPLQAFASFRRCFSQAVIECGYARGWPSGHPPSAQHPRHPSRPSCAEGPGHAWGRGSIRLSFAYKSEIFPDVCGHLAGHLRVTRTPIQRPSWGLPRGHSLRLPLI
jgi:hypothetical protein